ncbi:MAG: hypothetical protein M3R17_10030, partial [Bacteroidota bacterium]|nr:hypothetical protein [Bacteroidota bacterium]
NEIRYHVITHCYYSTSTRKNFLMMRYKNGYDGYWIMTQADLTKKNKTDKYRNPNRFFTEPKYIIRDNTTILMQLDANGISYMGGNVSEWLDNDYTAWQAAFHIRLKMLHSVSTPDAQLQYQLESYYDSFNAKNGKLVRGANWLDERYSLSEGKNPEGMNAKTFVDPTKSHCTLGFRYVVHVTKK